MNLNVAARRPGMHENLLTHPQLPVSPQPARADRIRMKHPNASSCPENSDPEQVRERM
jgi:hypothetical protein